VVAHEMTFSYLYLDVSSL